MLNCINSKICTHFLNGQIGPSFAPYLHYNYIIVMGNTFPYISDYLNPILYFNEVIGHSE